MHIPARILGLIFGIVGGVIGFIINILNSTLHFVGQITGITDTGGATLMIIGLGLISGLQMVTLKLVLVWVFILLTSPAAANALANAAYSSGHSPWIGSFRIMRDGGKRQP